MAGDLEDFLRRAAQRRAANEVAKKEQQRPVAAPRSRPEYTNSRTERRPQPPVIEDDEVVVIADIVQPAPLGQSTFGTNRPSAFESSVLAPVDQADERMKSHVQEVFEHTVGALDDSPSFERRDSSPPVVENTTRKELLELIRNPKGVRQALLLREIIDRPTHRW